MSSPRKPLPPSHHVRWPIAPVQAYAFTITHLIDTFTKITGASYPTLRRQSYLRPGFPLDAKYSFLPPLSPSQPLAPDSSSFVRAEQVNPRKKPKKESKGINGKRECVRILSKKKKKSNPYTADRTARSRDQRMEIYGQGKRKYHDMEMPIQQASSMLTKGHNHYFPKSRTEKRREYPNEVINTTDITRNKGIQKPDQEQFISRASLAFFWFSYVSL